MDINKLEAGEELDVLIATKVMGWTLTEPHWIHGELMHGMVEVQTWEGSLEGTIFQTKTSWHPSVDIAAAWRALEKSGTDGVAIIEDDEGNWTVVWDGIQSLREKTSDPISTSFFIEGAIWCKTVPLAICKNVLKKAIEVENMLGSGGEDDT